MVHQSAGTVLVIEDDPLLRTALLELLAAEHYTVLSASDGDLGFQTARALRPDALILDLGLPRMGGLDVLDRIHADPATRHVAVLLMTGQAAPPHCDLPSNADIIDKPFDFETLLAHVKRLVPQNIAPAH
jgi:DNA-binding response OmpR family regulator